MKKIFYVCIVLMLVIGCTTGQTNKDTNILRDSLVNMVLWGTLHDDTAKLEKALELSNYLLSIDTTKRNRIHCYHHRSMIFAWLGRMDEAMADYERVVMCFPKNNPQRLNFMSVKYLKKHNKDSADYYIEKTISVCDKSLNKEFNEDMAMNKIKAIYLRDGEKAAKNYLSELLKKHPDSPLLESLGEEWKEWARMNEEELKLLNVERGHN